MHARHKLSSNLGRQCNILRAELLETGGFFSATNLGSERARTSSCIPALDLAAVSPVFFFFFFFLFVREIWKRSFPELHSTILVKAFAEGFLTVFLL